MLRHERTRLPNLNGDDLTLADADSHRARHGERLHTCSSDAHASRCPASERRARARGRRSRPRVAGAGGRDRAESPRARRRPRARLSHERGWKTMPSPGRRHGDLPKNFEHEAVEEGLYQSGKGGTRANRRRARRS